MQDTQDSKETQATNHAKETHSNVEKSRSGKSFIGIMKTHLGDTVAYSLLAVGLVVCFFDNFTGGLLVGLVTGLYFSKKIVSSLQNFQEILLREGIFRGFVIVIALCAFAISAPGLILGVILGAAIRPLLKGALTDDLGAEKGSKKKK
jgi:hypothetical protein